MTCNPRQRLYIRGVGDDVKSAMKQLSGEIHRAVVQQPEPTGLVN
jgi:hypothetical protein